LLAQKALASAVLSFAALVLLPLVAFLVGLVSYGAGEAVTPTGDAVDFPTALAAIGMSVVYLAIQLIWVAGLALFLSVLIDAPLGAVGGAVLVSILSQILEQITALGSLRQYLPTHFAFSWSDLIATDIDWTNLAKGTMSSLIYGLVFGTLAYRRFMTKDITS
jgi:ABC-2 type transport system permease protein